MDYGLRNGYSCRHTTARSARYQQLWQSLDKEYICLHAKLIPHRCRYKYLDTYLAGQLVPYTCQPEADPNRDGTLFLSSGQPLTRLHSRARSKAAERGYACRVVFCTVLFSFCREIPTESACCSRPPAMHVARLMQYPRAESVRPGCFQAWGVQIIHASTSSLLCGPMVRSHRPLIAACGSYSRQTILPQYRVTHQPLTTPSERAGASKSATLWWTLCAVCWPRNLRAADGQLRPNKTSAIRTYSGSVYHAYGSLVIVHYTAVAILLYKLRHPTSLC